MTQTMLDKIRNHARFIKNTRQKNVPYTLYNEHVTYLLAKIDELSKGRG